MTDDPTMSNNPNVQERTPDSPVDLAELGRDLLDEAAGNDNGRAALTLTPSLGGPLKQTVLAIRAGHELAEHTAPGPASLYVLEGTAVLVTRGTETEVPTGAWVPIPTDKHVLRVEDDVVGLLTVVPSPDAASPGAGG